MALSEPSTTAWKSFAPVRFGQAVWHFYQMLVDIDHRPRHGALFITLTEGDLFERNFAAFQATAAGSELIHEKPDTGAVLADKAALARLPIGSFGNAYARFMREARLDEQYYSAEGKAAAQRESLDPQRFWFRTRSGFVHDINHLLTGYRSTPLGEACLMAFRFAQLRHLGLGALCIVMAIGAKVAREGPVIRSMVEAFRRGWRTMPFEMLPWEKALHVSLASHRSWLGLTLTRVYPAPLEPHAYLAAVHDWSGKPMPDDNW